MSLTIAYMTSRKNPRSEWFFSSLGRELGPLSVLPRVVIVDYHHGPDRWPHGLGYCGQVVNVAPKPCIWQGPNRISKQNYFAASNARNTALCHAPDGYIAYVDDLSVLQPGWMKAVRECMSAGDYVALGAYKKVKKLVVENGVAKSYEEFPGGIDSRWNHGNDNSPVGCAPNWLFGCSLCGPVESFLSVNGWPEDLCDGMGFEDMLMGLAMGNAGWKFKYVRSMLTLESEEDHHTEPQFPRDDWHFEDSVPVRGGNGKDDKSHAALNIARQSKWFPNSFGEGGIRALRQQILSGEPFPIPTSPQHEWYTKQLLSEL